MKKLNLSYTGYKSLTYLIVVFIFVIGCIKNETPPPVIDAVLPDQGYIGDPVTLTGRNLSSPTKILFNQTPSEYALGTGTSITILVPPGVTLGTNTISVTTEGGQSNGINFEVMEDLRPTDPLPPILEKSFPDKNFINYPVLLYGNNLSRAQVTFNDIPATIYTNNQNVVTTLVPTGLPIGTVIMKVRTPRGESNTLDFIITGPPPTGPPIINFSIVTFPPPTYVPTISNNWSCGLFTDQGGGTFVDLETETLSGDYTRVGRYEFEHDENGYNIKNYVEVTDEITGETLVGHFSSEYGNPCILEMVLISTLTGEVSICSFDRKSNEEDLVCEE